MVADSDAAPPSIRKAGFREVAGVLRFPGQVGYPPGVATDAQVGFSVMAYQSAEMLFGRREEDGYISVRLQGACARAHQGGQKGDMTQRAKVGYCPCCTRPTHVAARSRYMAGEYSGHKAHGIQLWKEHGPWAVRYFAATVYTRGTGCLPSDWDWAAQYLTLEPPTLFDGYYGAERPGNTVLPTPSFRDASEGPSKPALLLSGVTRHAQGNISNRRRHHPIRRSSEDHTSIPTPPPTQTSVSQPRGGRRDETPEGPRDPPKADVPQKNPPAFRTPYRPYSPSHTPRTAPTEDPAR